MPHVIVYDCEFLTAPGAPQRFWNGPVDPDPIIAQIGAVKLSLDGKILDTLRLHVHPVGRDGTRQTPDPLFIRLTGITEEILDADGIALADALSRLVTFSEGATLWSWGKDELNMIAVSCWIAGITPPMTPARFANACDLLLKAGMPLEDVHKTRSNTLAAYYAVDHPPLRGHDGLDDALCVAYTLQHLLRTGTLSAADFERP
ncbi:exonuclease [Pararhodobacter zhoushanensis]|uniref:exonuclease n=1 Tax=Pararhodobacter zhoushanensis TaxID=2479545 RepID=UPI000F8F3B12|nr:exonuclease [Pararhodobacter zhoushanensis]